MPRVTRRAGRIPLGADPRSTGPAFARLPKEEQAQRLALYYAKYPQIRGAGLRDKIRKLDQDFGNFLLRNLKRIPIPGVKDIVPRIVKKIEGEAVYNSRPIPHEAERPIVEVIKDVIPWISTVAQMTEPSKPAGRQPLILDRQPSRGVIIEELPDDYPMAPPPTPRLAIMPPPTKRRGKTAMQRLTGAGMRKAWLAKSLAATSRSKGRKPLRGGALMTYE